MIARHGHRGVENEGTFSLYASFFYECAWLSRYVCSVEIVLKYTCYYSSFE